MKFTRGVLPLAVLLVLLSACSVQNADPKPTDPNSEAAAVVRQYYEAVLAGNWNGVCALALPAARNALGGYCEKFIADLYQDKTSFFRDPAIDAGKATPVDQPTRSFEMPNDARVTVQVEQGFIFGPEGLEVVKVDGRWFWVSGNSVG